MRGTQLNKALSSLLCLVCFQLDLGQDDLLKSFPTYTVLWFYFNNDVLLTSGWCILDKEWQRVNIFIKNRRWAFSEKAGGRLTSGATRSVNMLSVMKKQSGFIYFFLKSSCIVRGEFNSVLLWPSLDSVTYHFERLQDESIMEVEMQRSNRWVKSRKVFAELSFETSDECWYSCMFWFIRYWQSTLS